jgi:ferredoxin-nitrate reductase
MGFGQAFAYRDVEEIFDEFKQTTRGRDLDMTGITYERLRAASGLQWPAPEGQDNGAYRLYTSGRFPTPSGRARFHPVDYRPPAEPVDETYPFALITGRVKDQWHTRTRTGKIAKLNKSCPGPYVEIHPDDAASLGIRPGQLVEVRSRRGAVRLPARLSRAIRPGAVFVPFHWAQLWSPETAVNRLTVPAADPVSREPELKHCAVRLTPVAPNRRG